jgi:hypothetical protein
VVTASREKYATARARIEAAQARAVQVETVAAVPPAEKKEVKVQSVPLPISEPPQKPAAPPAVTEIRKPAPTAVEGMGGAQHQAIQKRIKEAAEGLGFLAIIEKEIPNGSVDLALQKNGVGIACEISVTTTIDHEFGNVRKCVEAGFAHVAVISGKSTRLEQIEEAVTAGLGTERSPCVSYHTPDQFIDWLKSLPVNEPPPNPAEPTVTVRRGRRVTRKAPTLTAEERREKETARIALLAEIMQKKRSQ